MLASDFQQRAITVALVLIKNWKHDRLASFPFARRDFVVPEVFLQCLGVHFERQIRMGVTLNDFQNLGGHIVCFIPVALEPRLQFLYFPA